jgi:hypothetical protein
MLNQNIVLCFCLFARVNVGDFAWDIMFCLLKLVKKIFWGLVGPPLGMGWVGGDFWGWCRWGVSLVGNATHFISAPAPPSVDMTNCAGGAGSIALWPEATRSQAAGGRAIRAKQSGRFWRPLFCSNN